MKRASEIVQVGASLAIIVLHGVFQADALEEAQQISSRKTETRVFRLLHGLTKQHDGVVPALSP